MKAQPATEFVCEILDEIVGGPRGPSARGAGGQIVECTILPELTNGGPASSPETGKPPPAPALPESQPPSPLPQEAP